MAHTGEKRKRQSRKVKAQRFPFHFFPPKAASRWWSQAGFHWVSLDPGTRHKTTGKIRVGGCVCMGWGGCLDCMIADKKVCVCVSGRLYWLANRGVLNARFFSSGYLT